MANTLKGCSSAIRQCQCFPSPSVSQLRQQIRINIVLELGDALTFIPVIRKEDKWVLMIPLDDWIFSSETEFIRRRLIA